MTDNPTQTKDQDLSMTERVAQAMRDAAAHSDRWQTIARAGIAAMREPREAMIAAMFSAVTENSKITKHDRAFLAIAWQAAINKALEE